MPTIFDKLNLGNHRQIVVLNAPASFAALLDTLVGVDVRQDLVSGQAVHFGIAFATTQETLDSVSARLANAAQGDAVLWFAYPKASSKNYRCEFNRDQGWAVLGAAGFEGVRQIAIDEDWSALRFRRVEFIRAFTRSAAMAHSVVGRERGRK